MCTSDMTMIGQSWSKEDRRILANFNNVHTCRDFDALRRWSDGRNAEDETIWPSVADRLKAG